MRRRDIALLGAAGLISATSARAQGSWPDRPVMVISPYPPGGGSDIVARAVAKALGDATGQPFVVENRSGAAGSLGAAQVARARPDGYTILIGGSSPIAANKLLYRNLPYDPEKDFTPLSLVAEAPLMLMANPSTPVRSVPELVAYAKARPGEVTCANAGSGSKGHLAVLALCHRAGIELNHIPYRGTGPAQTDILAGTVMVGIDTASVYVPHVRSGAVRALGVSSSRRMEQLPQVPTIAEQGFDGYEATVWYGAVGPAGIPQPIADRIAGIIDAWLKTEAARGMLRDLGMAGLGGTTADLARAMRDEIELWRPIVQAAGITAD